ncbi:MAG TPA: NAD(P)H-dependent oxidoreductase [Steroidobacteraceae bacterium]|nr:NAD(P)H-dependent oxidoreductase [Steroidobacteraceae bacterium]
MRLLHIDSSILGDGSASRALTHEIVAQWRARVPGIEVRYLDLGSKPLPHLSGTSLARADAEEAGRADQALEDFLAADVLVIGAPMYNFSIPSQLKAWIDRVAVAGKTFRYTASGPEGLAKGKRAVIAISRGSVYPEASPAEFVEPYLRHLLGFLGIEDVTFVRAEGLSVSPEHRERGLGRALALASQTVAGIASAA